MVGGGDVPLHVLSILASPIVHITQHGTKQQAEASGGGDSDDSDGGKKRKRGKGKAKKKKVG